MKAKLYQYSKCSTCRKAIKFLDSKNISYDELDITEHPPKKKELELMLKSYDGGLKKLFNTSGVMYREMKLSKKMPEMTKKEAIDLLSKNGKLVKRPFLLHPKANLVGFKEEEWKKL